jgi:tetratricopeptide (TPR) repeat protein
MRKTLTVTTALVVGVFAAASLVSAPAAFAQAKPSVSKAVAKPLKAAQDAIGKKNWAEAIARLKEAEAVPGRTAYDTYALNELAAYAYGRAGNYGEAARAIEATLNSGFVAPADVGPKVESLAKISYQQKDYPKAIEYGNRALKGGNRDEDLYTIVGQSYYLRGDYKGTLKFMNDYVDDIEKRGGKPKEQSLQIIMSSCLKLEDDSCTTRALERLVADYPKPEYWQNITYSMLRAPDNSERVMLNTYRLAADVGALKRPDDYTEMAQLAIEQGSPGEAVAILNKAFERNVFTEQRDKDRNQRLLDSAKKQAAADQASLAKIEKEAKTGDAQVGLGKAYLSYGQYDQAIIALQGGIAKGGLRNLEEAQLMLGIAQMRAGRKDEAIKTFRSVKGDEKYARLGNLWALHASG